MHKSQSRSFFVVVTALLAVLLSACCSPLAAERRLLCCAPRSAQPVHPAPRPGRRAQPQPAAKPLQAARWSDLPGWNDDDLAAAWPAFLQSCRALAKRPQWPQWQAVCDEARGLNGAATAAIRRFFESRFQPWLLTNPDGSSDEWAGDRLLRTAAARFADACKPFLQPVLGVPPDLLNIDLGAVLPDLKNMRLRGRLQGNRVVPYFSRVRKSPPMKRTTSTASCSTSTTRLNCSFCRCRAPGASGCPMAANGAWPYADQNGHPYQSIGGCSSIAAS
jgi:membrane-bound lytic murein transglycosylase A